MEPEICRNLEKAQGNGEQMSEQNIVQQPLISLPKLEVSDIQATILRSRPSPYRGEYVGLRIDDTDQGREMLRRLIPYIAPAEEWWTPSVPAWLGIAFTHVGLKALGLPQSSLDSFPHEFREGMAARAAILNDCGANAPTNWEVPFGTQDLHIALAIYSVDDESLDKILEQARAALHELPQISIVYRLKFHELPGGRNPFGFRDGLHNPDVEGSGSQVSAGYGKAIKAGEFVIGYPDELGEIATSPQPEILRRNGTFIAFRKLVTRVAEFRKYLHEQASSPEEEKWLAAKMFGRWPSGAPLVLAPDSDDAVLGADLNSNNAFSYKDDMQGMKCPFSAHIRRVNPRDALANEFVAVDLHHFLRRGTNYGPPLPEGVMEDDGIERGGVFLFVGAHLNQQFEFVQSQWVTDGNFISLDKEQDPIIGNDQPDKIFTIPHHPIRRRLHGLPQFVTLRGGEYFFMPGLRALKWLSGLAEEEPCGPEGT